jgi:histidine triad (HIT) family protein
MPDCPFCAIVAGAPAHIVVDRAETLGFLDVRPLFPGHVLVIPKPHLETLADLPTGDVAPLFGLVQLVAAGVEQAMQATGSFVAVNNKVSQSVPHLHVHVVPRTKGDGLRGFFWPRQRYSGEAEMADVAGRIRTALDNLTTLPPSR